jgi:asparagine synthase (glutamine-hydrolysing)
MSTPRATGCWWPTPASTIATSCSTLSACRAGAPISDSELIFRGYAQWGDRLYERLAGDFAAAVWDRRRRSLVLARDHTGQRPLHYHVGSGFLAFASMPEGLQALPGTGTALDSRQLALFVADIPRDGSGSFYKDIRRVEPAHVVTLGPDGAHSRRYWDLPRGELRLRTQADYVQACREQLERATRARLRGVEGRVAAHLSGGWDSSAVAATAARIDPGAHILAVTAAPRRGFAGPAPGGRINDESGLAAETASLYPNMEHLVLRSGGLSPLRSIASDATLFREPIGHPCNHSWWSASNEAVGARGISVLLTGEAGNLT